MYSIVRRQDRNGGRVGAYYTTNTTVCLYKISYNNHSQKQHMLLTSLCTTTRRGETNGYFIIERQYRQSRTHLLDLWVIRNPYIARKML